MLDKEKYINNILQEVFALDDPAIDKAREGEVRDFVTRTIN